MTEVVAKFQGRDFVSQLDGMAASLSGFNTKQQRAAAAVLGLDKEQRNALTTRIQMVQSGKLMQSSWVTEALAVAGVTENVISQNSALQQLVQTAGEKQLLNSKEINSLLAQAATTGQLTAAQQKQIQSSLRQAQATAAFSQASAAAATGVNSFGTALKGLLASNPLGWIMLGITLLTTVVTIFEKIDVTAEEQRQKLAEIRDEYNALQEEISSLNEQLQTTNSQIAELEGKAVISDSEQQRLELLKQQNIELERQLNLEKLQSGNVQRNLNTNFVMAMEKSENKGTGFLGLGSSEMNQMEANLKEYKEWQYKFENVPGANRENIQQEMDMIGEEIFEQLDAWSAAMEGISYIPDPKTEEEKKVNEYLDTIENYRNQVLNIMGGSEEAKSSFLYSINKAEFQDTAAQLQELAKQGKLSGQALSDMANSDEGVAAFVQQLIDCGFITDASIDNLNRIQYAFTSFTTEEATEEVDRFGQALDGVKGFSDRLSSFQSAAEELSSNGNLSVDTILSLSEAFRDVEGMDEALNKLANASTPEQTRLALQGLANAYLNSSEAQNQLADGQSNLIFRLLQQNDALQISEEAMSGYILQCKLMKDTDFSENTHQQAAELLQLAQNANLAQSELGKLIRAEQISQEVALLQGQIENLQAQPHSDVTNSRISELQSRINAYLGMIEDLYSSVDLTALQQTPQATLNTTSSDNEQSPAERAREEWNSLVAEKKHEMAMDRLTEAEYYAWLQDNYDKYLTDEEEFLSDRRSIEEELYTWQKQQAEEQKQEQQQLLQDQLSALKEFYDEQKQLLRDQYEEEDRIREQAEKRQTVADLEREIAELSRDTSFKALKRRQELQQELEDAREELRDFERDQLLSETEQLYDDLYEQQEALLNARLQRLEQAETPEEIALAIAGAQAVASPAVVPALSASLPTANLPGLALSSALQHTPVPATADRTQISPTITFGDTIVYTNTDADFLRLLEAHRQQVARTVVGVFKQL